MEKSLYDMIKNGTNYYDRMLEAVACLAPESVRINIKLAREAAGLSQSDLAERIGTTRQQIGKYEAGAQDMTVARLFHIANALGVEPGTLIK